MISSSEEEEEHTTYLYSMVNHEDEVHFSNLSHDEMIDIIDDLLINSKNILSKYSILKKENELLKVENSFLKSEVEALKACF